MHTDIKYEGTDKRKRAKAMKDLKNWFGAKRWRELNAVMANVHNCEQFLMACSIGGVTGYPVRVWYESYHGEGSWHEPSVHI